MSEDENAMLPAYMPTIAYRLSNGKAMWFPNGVFGEWHDFNSLAECVKAAGAGMYVITIAP